jgi:hypothetical protein
MALISILAAVFLFFTVGCGRQVDLDPRDVEAMDQYGYSCDRNSASVELKIINRGSASVDVYLYTRAGGRRRIGMIGGFAKRLKVVGRYELQLGGAFLLRQSSGLSVGNGEAVVQLNPLSCDVGTLEIGSTVNLSSYMGMDFYPDEEFRK